MFLSRVLPLQHSYPVKDFMGNTACIESKSADPMGTLSFNLRHDKQIDFPFPLLRP